MTDWSDFIKCERGLLIAPAGHGKTTAIADCLLQCSEKSRQLILTHTHAGIASLRTKFQSKGIPSSKYHLETITGFAQRYVLAFLGSAVLPNETDKSYFSEAIDKCRMLMQSRLVQTIVRNSYDGVFVDEYQDCTINQHAMIMELAYDLPLHLLGDPLQGIFTFESKRLVDFERDLGLFVHFSCLNHPWRWDSYNPKLGNEIWRIRQCLEKHDPVNLQSNASLGVYVILLSGNDQDDFKIFANQLRTHDSESLLIVCPSYQELNKYGKTVLRGILDERIKIKQRIDFENRYTIIDAIDSADDYSCAKRIDSFIEQCVKHSRINKVARFYDVLKKLHLTMSEINKWIDHKKNRFINRKGNNATSSSLLSEKFSIFETNPTLCNFQSLITYVVSLPNVKKYHHSLYSLIGSCFNISQTNKITMLEAMKLIKGRIRHQGRSIQGRIIGTTLLTKGLEFDTVVVWNAHKFEDMKNFYVAISRACRKLVILTNKRVLQFPN